MSWLARSIADTLLIDDDDDEAQSRVLSKAQSQSQNDAVRRENVQGEVDSNLEHQFDHHSENKFNNNYCHNHNNDDDNDDDDADDDVDDPHGRGVKEDLSEFTETLTRQLWGVASFLAPPPPPPPPPPLRRVKAETTALRMKSENKLEDEEEEEEEGEYEEENVENLSDYVEEDDRVEEYAVGITEEALAFAQNIAHHPETWLDFPLLEEEDFEDFEISDAQYKHALAIERLAPRLAALRIEFCPVHMSEGYFWMVYFVLLHSRLNKHDADLLSTPQLVQARATWMQELQKQAKPETDWFGRKTFHSQEVLHSPCEEFDPHLSEDSQPRHHTTYAAEPRPYHASADFNTEKHPVEHDGVQFPTKSVEDPSGKSEIEKESLASPSNKVLLLDYDDDDGDDWLEETAKLEGFPDTTITVENEEDVSFSDLEEDFDWTIPVKSK